MIALFGALKVEVDNLEREMIITRRAFNRGFRFMEGKFAGRDVMLIQTGMGKNRARQAAEYILEHFSITAAISFGFGGSLANDLQIGDLVLCREIYHHCHLEPRQAYKSHKDLIATAIQVMESRQVNYLLGTGLTVDQLVSHPEERAMLAKMYEAQVVDMESYWIAEIAAQQKIPFLGIRAISDTVDQTLPPFDHFLDTEGKLMVTNALRHFLLNPGDLKMFPQLYLNSRKARLSLNEVLRALVPEISEERNYYGTAE